MATVERILEAARVLANELGAARLTTNAMADEAGISVGNLYYHFRNKDDVLLALFRQFEGQIAPLMELNTDLTTLDDWIGWWLNWFSKVRIYSFLFHDQRYLQNSSEHLRFHYHQWTELVEKKQRRLLGELKSSQTLVATEEDLTRLAREVTFIAIFWPDFFQLLQPLPGVVSESDVWDSALRQMLGLLLPYLRVANQITLEQIIANPSGQR